MKIKKCEILFCNESIEDGWYNVQTNRGLLSFPISSDMEFMAHDMLRCCFRYKMKEMGTNDE